MMDIQTEKIELAKLLLSTNDEHIIQSVKHIFDLEQRDFWNDLSEDQKKEIEDADEEIQRGDTLDYEIFMAKHRT